MDRRRFTKGGLLTALAAPPILGPTSALGSNLDESDARIAEFAPITLRLAARAVVLQWFVIGLGNSFVAMNVAGEQRQHNERRSRLGGLLGGLARASVEDRLKGATVLGGLYLFQNSLILLPDSKINHTKLEYTLYHRYFSYDLDAAFRVAKLGNMSADQIRQQSTSVGAAMIVGALVSLLISPVQNKRYAYR